MTADTGKVFDDALVSRQNGSGQDGHRSVLGAADDHITVKGFAPVNDKLFQAATLLLGSPVRCF